ncbi:PREDICTED: diphosphomevalonate decarboxylase-like [Rhagoletis zephyria]|uniref:diphosphomevalonate decarboxylase-like n=1 Tax=Rhagoletis zephyria TaxID=28612 RepID=UPI00081178EC|nr:PREDICTED: diphosphomevalonate decarboxylase-like [Rhagoletis zephyria]
MSTDKRTITVRAPVNIAVIKYWGKRDEKLIIPLNDSISGTLDMEQLCATTSVAISPSFKCNQMWLNGEEVDMTANERLFRCIQEVKTMVGTSQWPADHHLQIASRNNFPTAAGLASSAAGYACLMYALCRLFGVDDAERISTLARLGSGSACRSVYGGFVQWVAGTDHQSSIARQILDEEAWPSMRVLVLVVSDHRKDTSSSSGMKSSVETSDLMKKRVQDIVPQRITQMLTAIKERNFHDFAEITMRDSNQFHAICQDTYPPIHYMNDVSWSVVSLVHYFNKLYGCNKVAYTFDAGPNACLYVLENVVPELLALITAIYGKSESKLEVQGIEYKKHPELNDSLQKYAVVNACPGALKYVISTKLGTGPQVLSTSFDANCLIEESGGIKNNDV